ncbi:MAG: hypothetical protein J6O40_04970 [Ruminococcus sp.]|nr:hypothetical protein [Ruminococcus sp.]
MPTREETISNIKKELNVIPKQGAKQEDYDKYVSLILDKMKSADPEGSDYVLDAIDENLKEKFGNDKDMSPERVKVLKGINSALAEQSLSLKIEAGDKIDKITEKIKKGEYPGTESLTEDEDVQKIPGLAVNIFVVTYPDMYATLGRLDSLQKKIETMSAGYKFQKEVEIDDPEHEGAKKKVQQEAVLWNDELSKQSKEVENKLYENKYKDFAAKREEYTGQNAKKIEIEDKHGFEINREYKEGEPLFNKLPEDIERLKNADTAVKLEEEREKLNNKMDACDKYINNIKIMAKNARAMLKELDAMERTDGKANSKEYEAMRESLEKVSKLDRDHINPAVDPDNPTKPMYDPKEIDSALTELNENAAAYQKKNDSVFTRQQALKNRVDMSKRLQTFTAIAQPIVQANRFGLSQDKSVMEQRAVFESKLPRIESARKKRGYEEFKQHVKFEPTPLQKIENAIKAVSAAKEGVKGGSSAFSDAEKELIKARDLYKQHMDIKFKSFEEERKSLESIQKHIRTAQLNTRKYIKRKLDKGQIQAGATSDLKTQLRINAMVSSNEALNSLDRTVDGMVFDFNTKVATHDMEIERENYNRQIESEKRIRKFEAEQAMLNKNENEPIREIAAEGEVNARIALENMIQDKRLKLDQIKEAVCKNVAAVLYNEAIRNTQNLPQNVAKSKEEYAQAIKELANSPEVKNATEGLRADKINEFLADPTPIVNKVKQTRQIVRNIENNADNLNRNEINNNGPVIQMQGAINP